MLLSSSLLHICVSLFAQAQKAVSDSFTIAELREALQSVGVQVTGLKLKPLYCRKVMEHYEQQDEK